MQYFQNPEKNFFISGFIKKILKILYPNIVSTGFNIFKNSGYKILISGFIIIHHKLNYLITLSPTHFLILNPSGKKDLFVKM